MASIFVPVSERSTHDRRVFDLLMAMWQWETYDDIETLSGNAMATRATVQHAIPNSVAGDVRQCLVLIGDDTACWLMTAIIECHGIYTQQQNKRPYIAAILWPVNDKYSKPIWPHVLINWCKLYHLCRRTLKVWLVNDDHLHTNKHHSMVVMITVCCLWFIIE